MRTTDFSRAPKLARVEAAVISTAARRAPGHPVRTMALRQESGNGLIALYATADEAIEAAEELRARGGGRTTVLHAARHGYTNGSWNAEDGELKTVESFTATSSERARGRSGPRVVDTRARARRPVAAERRDGATPRVVPDATEAHAMFFGATKYTSPLSWVAFARQWFPMVARMQRMAGYRGHRVYWTWPFTLGTIAFFDSRDALLSMARGPEHRYLMSWLTDSSIWATAGYIRFLETRDAG
ncbi:MAG: hypothetical protein QM607_01190 [Microbacterium sp.]